MTKFNSNPKKISFFSAYCSVILNTSSKLIVPKKKKFKKIAIGNQKSPILFRIIAFIHEALGDSFLYKKQNLLQYFILKKIYLKKILRMAFAYDLID